MSAVATPLSENDVRDKYPDLKPIVARWRGTFLVEWVCPKCGCPNTIQMELHRWGGPCTNCQKTLEFALLARPRISGRGDIPYDWSMARIVNRRRKPGEPANLLLDNPDP